MNKSKQRGFLRITTTDVWVFVTAVSLVGWAFWSFVFWLFSLIHISFGA